MQVGLVRLKSEQDSFRWRAVLVDLHDREQQSHDVLDEVVQKVLVALIDLYYRLVLGRYWVVVEVEVLKVDWLLGVKLLAVLNRGLVLQEGFCTKRPCRRRLESAEC